MTTCTASPTSEAAWLTVELGSLTVQRNGHSMANIFAASLLMTELASSSLPEPTRYRSDQSCWLPTAGTTRTPKTCWLRYRQ